MSDFTSAIHPKRSFSARAAACRAAVRFVKSGTNAGSGTREAERTELINCLEQTADMLDRFASSPGFAAEIGKLMERTQ